MKIKRYTQGGYDYVNTPPYKADVRDGYAPSLTVKFTISVLDTAVFLFFVAILFVALDAMFFNGSHLYEPICDFMLNIGR